ncbi:MAG: hypothetical protein ABIP04_03325, partial [Sulfuriferula sp.]
MAQLKFPFPSQLIPHATYKNTWKNSGYWFFVGSVCIAPTIFEVGWRKEMAIQPDSRISSAHRGQIHRAFSWKRGSFFRSSSLPSNSVGC